MNWRWFPLEMALWHYGPHVSFAWTCLEGIGRWESTGRPAVEVSLFSEDKVIPKSTPPGIPPLRALKSRAQQLGRWTSLQNKSWKALLNRFWTWGISWYSAWNCLVDRIAAILVKVYIYIHMYIHIQHCTIVLYVSIGVYIYIYIYNILLYHNVSNIPYHIQWTELV